MRAIRLLVGLATIPVHALDLTVLLDIAPATATPGCSGTRCPAAS